MVNRKILEANRGQAGKPKDTAFVIDGHPKCNISVFFNHSCNPIMEMIKTQILTHNPRFPENGLFAQRDIFAGEELTWNYSYTVPFLLSCFNLVGKFERGFKWIIFIVRMLSDLVGYVFRQSKN